MILWHRDSAGNTAEKNSSTFYLIQTCTCNQQRHVDSKNAPTKSCSS